MIVLKNCCNIKLIILKIFVLNITNNTLLIVVDTNNPLRIESRELIRQIETIHERNEASVGSGTDFQDRVNPSSPNRRADNNSSMRDW